MGFIYFYKRHFLVIRCRKKTSKGLLEAVAFEDGRVSFSPWLFWAMSSGLILSYFKVLFPALTIARLCQEDFQDVGFHSERVVRRVETASGKAEHSGVARTCFSIVRKAPGRGPATTRSGGGSCVVTLPVCNTLGLRSSTTWSRLLHLGLPSVGLSNYLHSSGLPQVLVPLVTTALTSSLPLF